MVPMTKHLDTMGGSGPWLLKEYTPNKLISYVPNPSYFGKHPQLRMVVKPFVAQSDTSYKQYEANQIDQAPVPIAQLDRAKVLPTSSSITILPWRTATLPSTTW